MASCPSCGKELPGDFPFCPFCAAPLQAVEGTGEQRKTVTVVFCDLTSSTALGESLDPEPLRELLSRYFERMKGIVELHGGVVEKFIGDAVMAVFGIPQAHEDDALRAVRAAAEMQGAFPEFAIEGRIGVNTGEVVTGSGAQRLATGDAVNVAARLEQAAAPGEVLLGEPTLALVSDAVDVEALEPLALKGKSEPVPAFRLRAVGEAPERRHDSAFVGREREIEALAESWRRAVDEQSCELVTVIGDAGVGKSRLVAELLPSFAARVVRGRCLPYGEGVGYWPAVEVLKQLSLLPEEEAAAAAIRALLGQFDASPSADELAWAFRKTLERAAAQGPLVVVFDDLQWGGESFLDLVEHVALFTSGVPLLVLGMARPELLDRRPSWPAAMRLEPLGKDEVEMLVPETFEPGLRERIIRGAGGNPLFVHEMVAIAAETQGDVGVPPTLQALLAARLDQLERPERNVLEYGAVEGEVFHRGAVQALAGEEQVTAGLAALVRKQLIRPEPSQIPGDDGFRFRHLLIRDAAYDGLRKAKRAELHAAHARWLDGHGQSLVELDEVLAYHYDQACRYREEVGLPPDPELVETAVARLRAIGLKANFGGDYATATRLLTRTLVLAGEPVDVVASVHLADAIWRAGRGDEALEWCRDLVARAEASGDRRTVLSVRLQELWMVAWLEPQGTSERLEALVAEAQPELEAVGDDYGLFLAARARGHVANFRGQLDEVACVFDEVAERTRTDRPGYVRLGGLNLDVSGWQTVGRYNGTTPVREVISWIEGLDPAQLSGAYVRSMYAGALAMSGRLDEARALQAGLLQELREQGNQAEIARVQRNLALRLEELAGDPAAAAAAGAAGCAFAEERGEGNQLSTTAPRLARVLCRLGRVDEADRWVEKGREVGAVDHAETQFRLRQANALIAAGRGRAEEAIRLAREAVVIADATDMLNDQGDVYFDLGEVLALAGAPAEAAPAYELATDCYERKGNVVSATRSKQRRRQLEHVPS